MTKAEAIAFDKEYQKNCTPGFYRALRESMEKQLEVHDEENVSFKVLTVGLKVAESTTFPADMFTMELATMAGNTENKVDKRMDEFPEAHPEEAKLSIRLTWDEMNAISMGLTVLKNICIAYNPNQMKCSIKSVIVKLAGLGKCEEDSDAEG